MRGGALEMQNSRDPRKFNVQSKAYFSAVGFCCFVFSLASAGPQKVGLKTQNCFSPQKSLIKGERVICSEKKPEYRSVFSKKNQCKNKQTLKRKKRRNGREEWMEEPKRESDDT